MTPENNLLLYCKTRTHTRAPTQRERKKEKRKVHQTETYVTKLFIFLSFTHFETFFLRVTF